jgi:hypothetical protein
MVHSLQIAGTRVDPGLGLNGVGTGQSTKLTFPSIMSISMLLIRPQTLSKMATGNREFSIWTINGQGFNLLK